MNPFLIWTFTKKMKEKRSSNYCKKQIHRLNCFMRRKIGYVQNLEQNETILNSSCDFFSLSDSLFSFHFVLFVCSLFCILFCFFFCDFSFIFLFVYILFYSKHNSSRYFFLQFLFCYRFEWWMLLIWSLLQVINLFTFVFFVIVLWISLLLALLGWGFSCLLGAALLARLFATAIGFVLFD